MVGSELTRQLVREGTSVRILRRESSSLELLDDVHRDVEHAIGDVRDAASILQAMEGVDHVYHTAGFIGFSGRRDRTQLQAVNVQGTAHVVNAALRRGVTRLVHTSSMAAFGRPDRPRGVIDESAAWQASRQNSAYARSKYEAELEVYRAVAEGLDAVIVNPALIFGRARPGENTREIVEKVKARRLPGVPSGGTNVVDARDVGRGHRLAMLNGTTGERYFLGSENLTWNEIIGIIADALGVQPPARNVPPALAIALARLSEAAAFLTGTAPLITMETARTSSRFYRYSNTRAIEELGCHFRPFTETAEYVAETLAVA